MSQVRRDFCAMMACCHSGKNACKRAREVHSTKTCARSECLTRIMCMGTAALMVMVSNCGCSVIISKANSRAVCAKASASLYASAPT